MFKAAKSITPQASLHAFLVPKPRENAPAPAKRTSEDLQPEAIQPPKRVKLGQVLLKSFAANSPGLITVDNDVFNSDLEDLFNTKRTKVGQREWAKRSKIARKEKRLSVMQKTKNREQFSQALDEKTIRRRQRRIERIYEEYAGEEEGRLHDLVTNFYKIVLGTGSVSAQVMFIGSFPSWEETRAGDAFESNLHRRLVALLVQHDIDTTDKDCYYTNLVKIRPRDRWPTYKEVEEHLPTLLREIRTVKPKIIVCFDSLTAAIALRGFKLDHSLRGKYIPASNDYTILTEKSIHRIHEEGRNIGAVRFDDFRWVCRLHILPDLARLPSQGNNKKWEEGLQRLKDALFLPPVDYVEAHELLAEYYASHGWFSPDEAALRFKAVYSLPTDCFVERGKMHHRPLTNNYIVDHIPNRDRVRMVVNTVEFLEVRNEYILFCGTLENYSVALHVTDPTFEFWIRHGSFEPYVHPNGKVNFKLLTKRQIEEELELKLVSRLHDTWPFEGLTNEEIWGKLGVSVEYSFARSAFVYQPVRSRFLHVKYKHYSILRALKEVLSLFFHGCEFFETKVSPLEQLFFSHNIYNYGWIGIDPLLLSEVPNPETIDDLEFTCTASALRGRNPNTGQSRSQYDEEFSPMTFAATDFEMLKNGGGGAMPTPDGDAIVRICLYLSHTNPQLYAPKFEYLRDAEKPHLTSATGRTRYVHAAAFSVGVHGPLQPDVFKPEFLPYPPLLPGDPPGQWTETPTVPYLRAIYDWNQFVEQCVEWVKFVGTFRAKVMFNSAKLCRAIFETELEDLPKNQKEWQKRLQPPSMYGDWREKMHVIWGKWAACRPGTDIEHPDVQPSASATPLEKGTIETDWSDFHPEKWPYFFRTEKEMITGFVEYCRQAKVDVFTGHNVSAFDLTYLIKRIQVLNIRWSDYWEDRGGLLISLGRGRFTDSSPGDQLHCDTVTSKKLETKANGARIFSVIKIPGRDIFDTLHYAQKGDAVENLDGFTLSQLALRTVGDNKHDVPWSSIPSLFLKKPQKLTDYCMQDTELCERILNKLNTMYYVIGTCRVLGCMTIGQFYTTGVQVKILQLFIRQLKLSGLSKLMPDANPFSEPDEDRYAEYGEEVGDELLQYELKDEKKTKDSYTGATVLAIRAGFYYKNVIPCLDFAQLYPSIMDSDNLGYNTIGFLAHFQRLGIGLDRLRTSGELHPNPFANGALEPAYFLKRRRLDQKDAERLPAFDDQPAGLAQCTRNLEDDTWTPNLDISDIVTMNRILSRGRSEIKKEMERYPTSHPRWKILNPMQMARKVIVNSTYGACGVKSGRTACRPLAEKVTDNGRKKLEWVKTVVEDIFGGVAAGGDTDSVFPLFEKDIVELEDIFKPVSRPKNMDFPDGEQVTLPFIMHIVNHINARVPFPEKIAFEKAWVVAALYQKKQADLAECMPIRDPVTNLLTFENGGKPKISSKGTANKRRSTAPYAKRILEKFVSKIWKRARVDLEKGKRMAEKYVRNRVLEMRAGNFDYSQMILSTYYARTDYKSPDAPTLVINRKLVSRGQPPYPLGSRIPMVVTIGRPHAAFWEKVEDPDFAIENKIPLDIEYYIDAHLRKPLRRKCAVIDPSMIDRMFPPILKRTVFLSDTDAMHSHVRKLRNCALCKGPSWDALLCEHCLKEKKLFDISAALAEREWDDLDELRKKQETCYTCMGMDTPGKIKCINVHCKVYPVRKRLEFDVKNHAAIRVEFDKDPRS
jgi:uracil-DNA glycosylase family 4